MKRFSFRLDSVLKVRQFELDRATAALAEVEAERTARQAAVDQAEAQLEQGRQLLEADVAGGVDGEYLAMRADGVAAGRFKCLLAQRSLNELAETLRVARERVARARVGVRSIERLREKREISHRQESLKLEQAEIEELARASNRTATDEAAPGAIRGTG